MEKDKKKLFRETEARLHKYKYLDIQIKSLELDIETEKNNYKGYSAISYDEKTGATYNISRSVENEIINKERRLDRLTKMKAEKEIEKKKIENALTCLDIIETQFFDLFYNSKNKNKMSYISIRMNMDRSNCYRIRENTVNKVMSMLHPNIVTENLPLLNVRY